MRAELTHERLLELLHYDPATGVFTWRVGNRRKRAGDVAGRSEERGGYRVVQIDTIQYRAHRLAWFYMVGDWPVEIDHRDRDKSNTKWSNLRPATRTQNLANGPLRRDNVSGAKGVMWDVTRNKWRVQVGNKVIGRYADFDAACAVREAAALRQYGEFA